MLGDLIGDAAEARRALRTPGCRAPRGLRLAPRMTLGVRTPEGVRWR